MHFLKKGTRNSFKINGMFKQIGVSSGYHWPNCQGIFFTIFNVLAWGEAFIKQQKGRDSLSGQVVTKLLTSLMGPLKHFFNPKTLFGLGNPNFGGVILLKLFNQSCGFRDIQGWFCLKMAVFQISNSKTVAQIRKF